VAWVHGVVRIPVATWVFSGARAIRFNLLWPAAQPSNPPTRDSQVWGSIFSPNYSSSPRSLSSSFLSSVLLKRTFYRSLAGEREWERDRGRESIRETVFIYIISTPAYPTTTTTTLSHPLILQWVDAAAAVAKTHLIISGWKMLAKVMIVAATPRVNELAAARPFLFLITVSADRPCIYNI